MVHEVTKPLRTYGSPWSEAFNDGAIVRPPNENRSISRFGKGTCKDQVPTVMGFPSQRKMHLPERGAPSQIVINQCVLQQVVTHVKSVVRAADADTASPLLATLS